MIVERLEVGMFMSNCYIVGCPDSREALIIDPGAEGRRIIREVQKQELTVKYIVNTHVHVDHVGVNQEVMEATGAPLLVHEAEMHTFDDPQIKFLSFLGQGKMPQPDRFLREGEVLEVGNIQLEVLLTPGHSPGGICLSTEGAVFTGDTLFNGSVGRTDLPGGSFEGLLRNVKEKLLPLPDHTVVYPGHGPESTIGEEKVLNPFLQEY